VQGILHGMGRRPVCDRVCSRRAVSRVRVSRAGHGGGVRAENELLLAENSRLRSQLEAERRAGKRQAAPFSRGEPKQDPGKPGRRSGAQYGTKARRPVPDHVDEEIRVPMPECCPWCDGELVFEDEVDQYQEEIVWVRGHVRHFRIARGRCRRCGKRAQGRHRDQTSDAVGAAGSQLGAGAVALAAQLNKELGIAMGKVSQILSLFEIRVTPGGLYQALARLARAAEPTYEALALAVCQSAAVAADETGWRVAGRRRWLWVFVGDGGVTVYLIADGRGYEEACVVLGADFSGVLERDGWAPYRRFEHASHQTCVAHLLRRCGELISDSVAGQARVPHAVRRLLLDALALRDQHADVLSPHHDNPDVIEGTAVEIACQDSVPGAAGSPTLLARLGGLVRRALPAGPVRLALPGGEDRQSAPDTDASAQALAAGRAKLQARLERLVAGSPTHDPNRKLLAHLANESQHLLTFLEQPGIQATNWRAEQAIRPAVVNRKNWGGNRTPNGAEVQQTLMSVIRTSRQQHICPIQLLTDLQRHRIPAPSTMLRLPASASADPRGP
jgi:transposase